MPFRPGGHGCHAADRAGVPHVRRVPFTGGNISQAREKVFCLFAEIPKATVQAAVGGVRWRWAWAAGHRALLCRCRHCDYRARRRICHGCRISSFFGKRAKSLEGSELDEAVLLPIDGSERSIRSVELVKELFSPEQVEITLLTVNENYEELHSKYEMEQVRRQLLPRLDEVAALLSGFHVKKYVCFGRRGNPSWSTRRKMRLIPSSSQRPPTPRCLFSSDRLPFMWLIRQMRGYDRARARPETVSPFFRAGGRCFMHQMSGNAMEIDFA
jgi:hypothetical protein